MNRLLLCFTCDLQYDPQMSFQSSLNINERCSLNDRGLNVPENNILKADRSDFLQGTETFAE